MIVVNSNTTNAIVVHKNMRQFIKTGAKCDDSSSIFSKLSLKIEFFRELCFDIIDVKLFVTKLCSRGVFPRKVIYSLVSKEIAYLAFELKVTAR